MPYRVADQNNGPFGAEFETLKEAEAELAACIEEGTKANIQDGNMSRETAEAHARAFYCIVRREEDGAVMEVIE